MVARRFRPYLESLESRNLLAGDLVADIHFGTASSAPSELTPLGDLLLYAATGRESVARESEGRELWVTDTTTNRTNLVADIRTGTTGSNPTSFVRFQDSVYFFANDGSHGLELWKTTGTEESTQRVTDLWPENTSIQILEAVSNESHLFFIAKHEDNLELWRSDGTAAGTQRLTVQTNLVSQQPNDKWLSLAGNDAYFVVRNSDTNTLWKFEGDSLEVFEVPATQGKEAYGLTANDDELYYASGDAVWRIADADRDAVRIADFNSFETWLGRLNRIRIVEDGILVETCLNPNYCRWQSTTAEHRDFDSKVVDEPSRTFALRPRQTESQNARMAINKDWAKADDDWIIAGNYQEESGRGIPGLWRTDLTEDGTHLIAQVETASNLGDLAMVGETLFASIELDGAVGRELYRFDPTIETQTVAFSQASFGVREDGAAVDSEITITRSSGEGQASVAVAVYHSTAGHGDFVGYAGREYGVDFEVQFENGETTKTISTASMPEAQVIDILRTASVGKESYTEPESVFTLLNDDLYEPDESVFLRLWTSDSNLVPRGQVEARINIVDDQSKGIVLNHSDHFTDVMVGGAVDSVATSLNFAPNGTVVVKPSFDETAFIVTPQQLEFTPEDWSTPKYFTIEGLSAIDDANLTVSIDSQQTNETDLDAQPASFGFAIKPSIEFEEVSPGLGVANINADPQTGGLEPGDFLVAGEYLYFTGEDAARGRELWRTDGTEVGTFPLTDIRGDLGIRKETMSAFGGSLYFAAGPASSVSLWKSDGTANGTSVVSQLERPATNIVSLGDTLVVVIEDQIWALRDGEDLELVAGVGALIREVKAVGDNVFLTTATALWSSDATTDGTRKVDDVVASQLAELDGLLLFQTPQSGTRKLLFVTDGTKEGTQEVARNVSTTTQRPIREEPDAVYFYIEGSWLDRGYWKAVVDDGVVETSRISQEFGQAFEFDGDTFEFNFQLSRSISEYRQVPIVDYFTRARNDGFTVFEDRFYFVARNDDTGSELWVSDGTQPGTGAIDLRVGPASGVENLGDSAIFQGELYFAANNGITGTELWKTDGESGVTQVFDLIQAPTNAEGSDAKRLTKVNDTVYFVADDDSTSRLQLWATDAVSDAVHMLAVIPQPETTLNGANLLRGIDSQDLVALTPYGDELLFTHNYWYDNGFDSSYPVSEFELWKSDGTGLGTELILPFYQSHFDVPWDVRLVGPTSSAVDASGQLFLEGATYDGTLATSTTTPNPWGGTQDGPSQFTRVGDQLFFNSGGQLFVSMDGLATSTRVSPEAEGAISRLTMIRHGHTSEFVEFKGKLFYTAGLQLFNELFWPQEYTTHELWTSDGTPEGTKQVIAPDSGHLSNLTAMGETLFFTTAEPPQLFATDGTAEGTVLIQEFQSLGNPRIPEDGGYDTNRLDSALDTTDFVVFQDMLYFAADSGTGLELWRTDGTREGTEFFAEINLEEVGSDPANFTVVGSQLFFSADDGVHGRELWVTDGTAAGTRMHTDLNEGAAASNPEELLASDGLLYFVADDGVRGREVWRVDATMSEAVDLIGDINGDSEVNFSDFLVLSANFGSSTDNGLIDGDLDGDGEVGFTDFLLLSAAYGNRVAATDQVFSE